MSPDPEPPENHEAPILDGEARISELDVVAERIEAGQTWSEATPDGTVITMDADKYRAALAELAATMQVRHGPVDESEVAAIIDRLALRDREPGENQLHGPDTRATS